MPRLICNVRDCARELSRDADTLRCDRGHTFDRARSGHWNLLQPQDRRSAEAGDRAEALSARGRWLERGHAHSLAERIGCVGGVESLPEGATILDVGCGNGWFAEQLVRGRRLDLCGIDLSARAVRSAALRLPAALWIVANADRGLPLADRSVDLALSVFGRRPAAELARVLRPGGRLVIVVPAEDDLQELREATQGRALPTERTARVAEEFAATPLRLARHETWRRRESHDAEGIEELLAMTYRGVRHSQRERLLRRLDPASSVQVTLAAHLLRFECTDRPR